MGQGIAARFIAQHAKRCRLYAGVLEIRHFR
jgi:hypothetical protein